MLERLADERRDSARRRARQEPSAGAARELHDGSGSPTGVLLQTDEAIRTPDTRGS
jgi:hypothetical protein